MFNEMLVVWLGSNLNNNCSGHPSLFIAAHYFLNSFSVYGKTNASKAFPILVGF